MKNTGLLFRFISLVILLSLVFSLFTCQSTASAAAGPLVNISFGSSLYGGLPNQTITTTVTEVFENTTGEKGNVFTDILFTLPSNVDMGGVRVQAYTSTNVAIGIPITLTTGQSTFWGSAFGGALARKSIRKLSGSTLIYKFVFTPGAAQEGKDFLIKAQAAVAKKGFLTTDPKTWNSTSSSQISTTLRVYARPFLTSANIAGPYNTNITGTFLVRINNPQNGTTNSGLHLQYQIGNSDTIAPIINVLSYRTSTDNSTWSGMSAVTPITNSGEFGPADGYTLAAGNTLYIEVSIQFQNDTALFPITLTLKNAQGVSQDVLTSMMAVHPTAAQLFTSDLETPFNAGITQEFHVTAVNAVADSGGIDYPNAYINLTFQNLDNSMISQLEIFNGTSWESLQRTGTTSASASYGPFHLGNLTDLATTMKFRANFLKPGTYTVQLALHKDSASGSLITIPVNKTLTVLAAKPSLDLSDLTSNSPLTESVEQPFVVTISNPSTGVSYSSLNLAVTIDGVSLSKVAKFQYSLDGGLHWLAVPLSAGAGTSVVGTINPAGWSMASNSSLTINFRITITTTVENLMMTMKLNEQSTLLAEQSVYFDVLSLPVTGDYVMYLPTIQR